MNLASVIGSLSTGTYTVTRHGAGSYNSLDGRFTEGSPTTTVTITAVIQPTSGRDLLRLPEGLRTKETIAIWTSTLLKTASAPGGTSADVVTYNGTDYQVETVQTWQDSGGYYKAFAAKVGQ